MCADGSLQLNQPSTSGKRNHMPIYLALLLSFSFTYLSNIYNFLIFLSDRAAQNVRVGQIASCGHRILFFLIGAFLKINLFIFYFWLCWVFTTCGLSLVAANRGYSSLRCVGFSSRWLLLLWNMGSRHAGFSGCGTRAQ